MHQMQVKGSGSEKVLSELKIGNCTQRKSKIIMGFRSMADVGLLVGMVKGLMLDL